jgi:anti-sigma factor RsiW
MTCQELIDFMMAYLDGELAPEPRAVFEAHLKMCPPCVDYLGQYKTSVRLGQEAFPGCETEQLPSDVPEALVQAILEARKRER